MSIPCFRPSAAELDAAIQEQDRLILKALVEHVHPRFVWRAMQCRNDLVREWGSTYQTRTIAR